MRGSALLAVLLGAVAAAEDPREYEVRPFHFTVQIPAGWTAEQGPMGMVARDAKGNGFVVSREPFLHDPDTFAAAWRAQLGAAKLDAKVERTKVSRRVAWSASWTAGERRIEVWRLHVEDLEMLYNFSFSVAAGFELKPLVDATLKSFDCEAPKAELKFQQQTESITTRIQIRLPEGYEKDEPRPEDFALGGGLRGGFVRTLPGYQPPHVAGRIRFRGYDANVTYITEDRREIPGTAVDKLLDATWRTDEPEFASVVKKPRGRDTTLSGIRGSTIEVAVIGKDGLPKRWLGFCGKHKQDVVEVVLVVDERETRLHKDILKQVCSNLVVER
jgi:hypothetical protein